MYILNLVPGTVWVSNPYCVFRKREPKQATESPIEKYPEEIPRGGEDEISNRTDQRLTTHTNAQTTNVTCFCGKLFKNHRGLKIHQARMKCLERESEVQRTSPEPGETQEGPGQEATHRAQSLHAPEPPNPSRVVQQRIKWPPASKRSEWLQFDEDVSNILQATVKGDADSRLQTITTIIFSYALERFGRVEKGKTKSTSYTMNHRATKIHHLHQELCTLKKQYKKATDEEKRPLAELQNILRKKLMILRRAEWHRRRGRERARKRAAFIAIPSASQNNCSGTSAAVSLSAQERK